MKRETLRHCVKVYVPSKFGDDQIVNTVRQEHLCNDVIRMMGGAGTVYHAFGHWQGIVEYIAIVEVYGESVNHAAVEQVAGFLLGNGQQSVAIAIDGELSLFSE